MLVAPDLQQRSDPRVCRVDTAQLGPCPGAEEQLGSHQYPRVPAHCRTADLSGVLSIRKQNQQRIMPATPLALV